MKKWIRGGTVVTAADTYQADVLIDGERVAAIGYNLDTDGAEVIDATGCYLLPGGIDPHTHLAMPFGGTVTSDDFFTGTKAAAFGGTTSIVDFCLTKKGEPLQTAIAAWHEKARGKAVLDYGFHLMVSDANDQVLEELESVVQSEGITSLKVFMAYKNVLMADDETLFKTLIRAKELGALVQVHAENGDVIDYLTKQALGRRVFPKLSVEYNLIMGGYSRKVTKKEMQQEIDRVYHLFPRLKERRNQMAGTMSGGEQQMLAIGRALMARPKLLILDEPSMGLAPIVVKDIFQTIRNIKQQGLTTLLIEQNAAMALSVADRGYVLEHGEIRYQDTAENLRKQDSVKKAYLGHTG